MYVTQTVGDAELIIVICVLVIGLAENLTACAVILFSRSKHTITNYYLLSLSISDIMMLILHASKEICLYSLPWRKFYYNKYWDSGIFITDWILITAVNASTLVVAAFTAERYLAICHPFKAQAMSTTSRVKKIISILWTIAALLAFVTMVVQFIVYKSVLIYVSPHRQQQFYSVLSYFQLVMTIVTFFVPMIMITIMYILIGIKLHKRSAKRQISTGVDCASKNNLMMFFFIVVAFFLCWAPYYIGNVVETSMYSRMFGTPFKLIKAFSEIYNISIVVYPTLNPLIYTLMSAKFREAFKDLLSRIRRETFGLTVNSATDAKTTEIDLENN